MSQSTHPSYRPDIDGLRAIAVLAVVIFHAAPRLLPGGFIGVDIFFVISGYLISRIIFSGLAQGAFSFSDFYARRVRRIFPALSIVLAACLLFGWVYLLGDEYELLGKETAAGVAFVANIILWQESGYFDGASSLKPLLHLWSLGVEEQFYIVWPVLVVIAYKYGLNLSRIALVVAGASFAVNLAEVDGNAVAAFYLPHTRFWEFQFGCMLAYAAQPNHRPLFSVLPRPLAFLAALPAALRPRIENAKAIAGLLLIAGALVALDKDMAFPGWLALLPTVGASLLISAGPHTWINRKLLANHTFVFIGLISYPLYLWHWPLLAFARILEDGKPGSAVRAVCVAVAFLLAWLTWKYVERPIRKRRAGEYRLRFAVLPLSASMVLVGALGLAIMHWDGVPARFPEIVQGLANYKYPYEAIYRKGRCFLEDQTSATFHDECTAPGKGAKGSPHVFLWGDSHAAHLYPGIRHLQKEYDFTLSQYTASGCPPALGIKVPIRPDCNHINEIVLAKLSDLKPDSVILAANWPRYHKKESRGRMEMQMLRTTIEKVAAAGVKNILVVGTVPQWERGLPKALFNSYRLNKWTRIPTRMASQLKDAGDAIDVQLNALASEMGVAFISPKSTLCNAEGCLTTTDGSADNLTAFDYGHLTEAGSIFVAQHNLQAIFPQLPARAGSPRQ